MSPGQNDKVTQKHIFLFSNINFPSIKQCRYDYCTHLWKICTVLKLISVKLQELVKACPWAKITHKHIFVFSNIYFINFTHLWKISKAF